jgi:hypothetical protein
MRRPPARSQAGDEDRKPGKPGFNERTQGCVSEDREPGKPGLEPTCQLRSPTESAARAQPIAVRRRASKLALDRGAAEHWSERT